MIQETWRVVGGSKGGIVVRQGKVLTSPELPERLSKGSLLRQKELLGERLHFERITGSGPASGWVSTKVGGKDIVVKGGCVPLEKVNFGRPIIKSAASVGVEVWLVIDHRRDTAQSYAALALGLLKGNYRVRLFGPRSFEVLVRSLGIPFTVAGSTLDEWQERMFNAGESEKMWDFPAMFQESARSICQALQAAMKVMRKPPELLCTTTTLYPVAIGAYSKYGVGTILCNVSMPLEAWDAAYFGMVYSTAEVVQEVFGVSPFKGFSHDAFYGTLLGPRQLLGTSVAELGSLEDGGEQHREIATKIIQNFSGYWFLPADLQIKVEQEEVFGGPTTVSQLEAFLQQGPAVYIGWGRKVYGDMSGHATALAVGALKALKMRGIIVAGLDGGPGPDALAAALFPVDSEGLVAYAQANILFLPGCAPHDWLFPRCALAVHHGGSGTTAACFRGSCPMVIMPAEDKNWRCGMHVEKQGAGALVKSGLYNATKEELIEAIKLALKPSAKAKAKEFGTGLSLEFGVRNAVVGMNMLVQGEVKTGNMREEWKKLKAQEAKEEAFQKELDEEPEDGVLRPPPELLEGGLDATAKASSAPGAGAKPAAQPRAPPATARPPPPWLRPDGKGKVMTVCSPLKGHVIHFKRIAQWIRDCAPGWEVHMVLFVDEPDLPPGVFKYIADKRPNAGKAINSMTSIFAAAAGLESADDPGKKQKRPEEDEEDDALDILSVELPRLFAETFMRVKPNVVINELMFNGLCLEGFAPALCRTYEALLISIIPMCIKEDMGHAIARVQKTLERRQNKVFMQAIEVGWALESLNEEGGEGEEFKEDEEGGAGEEEAEQEGQQEMEEAKEAKALKHKAEKEEDASRKEGGEADRPPWWPKSASMDELNHIIWKVMPATQHHPNLLLYPSPGFFHVDKPPDPFEVYCAPFLPLPSTSQSGATQHGRETLEGSINPELLDWLFSPESDDPIVYVAFGTIVSQFNSRWLVERLVEALSDAPWRVLMVLPEDTRAGLPKEGDTNFWRWTAVGAEVVKGMLMDVREGDVFTEEHFARFRKGVTQIRDHAHLLELGIISETKARFELLRPDRFRVESFVPQVHVLRCERVRCFVSHMGANSTLESMAAGVPMLCTPFFMDQYEWAHTVRQNLRAGIQVNKILSPAEAFRGAVKELLEVPAYRRNAQAVARRIATQSDLLTKNLGPAMQPKVNLGPGLSVLGAFIVSHIKKQDVWPSLEGPLCAPLPSSSGR